MIQQLRVLDPSVSAEVGTPERKIIDTVAQALADAQVDLVALNGALDLDSKFGSNLEKFLALFGFARQKATPATGVVTFSRTTPSNIDIRIPFGTQVASGASADTFADDSRVTFVTTAQVTLPAGETSVQAPVRAAIDGDATNVAANTITAFVGTATIGVTDVTNPAATVGGRSSESDDEFKLRFKNTVFRNLSGTQDQFLALAVSTAYTTKATVVGPISRYREYIQIPASDDSDAGGSATEWTSALSTIPYSKHVYDAVPSFVSNGASGIATRFFTQGLDFTVNTSAAAKDRGDARRIFLADGEPDPTDASTLYQPNVTFQNVVDADTDLAVWALREGDIVLFEHSYMSAESRNDADANISNCVDVFIDGTNRTTATVVISTPTSATPSFSASASSSLYQENFRRIGEPEHRPVVGNRFSPLPFQPVISLPSFLEVGDETYYEGTHYWGIEEVSDIGGTIRTRNGIEWSATVKGEVSGNPSIGPYTGTVITSNPVTFFEVTDYVFDKNVIDLQSALEGAKQVTTDVLAHRARTRSFKLDLTVMYAPGASAEQINLDVYAALSTFLSGQYFGTTIQLSDLLQVVHNVGGIDNVRWTRDIDVTADRIVEVDTLGRSLHDAIVDRRIAGGVSASHEVQGIYFPIEPDPVDSSDTFRITVGANTTAALARTASIGTINSALTTATIAAQITAGTGTPADPYLLQYTSTSWIPALATVTVDFPHAPTAINTDFYLRDNELPALPTGVVSGDTIAGLVIRPRAQNTWTT